MTHLTCYLSEGGHTHTPTHYTLIIGSSLPTEHGINSQYQITLQILFSHRNRLASLPINFDHLVSLRELNLSQNHLVSVSSSITALSRLKYLSLAGNGLKFLPRGIPRLQVSFLLYPSRQKIFEKKQNKHTAKLQLKLPPAN